MAQKIINLGSNIRRRSADSGITAWDEANENFTELYARTAVYSIVEYGAIGDGLSHPLSSRFASLADAQSVYPNALSLDEEINFHAVQKAIDAASARTIDHDEWYGGTVFVPAGYYVMNNANAHRTLVRPERSFRPYETGAQINFRGEGWTLSVLYWPADAGTDGDTYAFSCGDPSATFDNPIGRYASTGLYEGYMQDLMFQGPGAESLGDRSKNCNLTGLAWGARLRLIRCCFYCFYSGISLVGDWCSWYDVYCYYNYYGVHIPRRSSSLYGNIQMNKCMLSGNRMASVALHPRGYMRWICHGCFFGGAPYAICMEAGTSAVEVHILSAFYDCQFESVGNSILADFNGLNGGSKAMYVERTLWRGCSFQMNSGNKITTDGHENYSLFNAHSFKDCYWEQMSDMPEGSVAIIDCDTIAGGRCKGNLSFMDDIAVPFLKTGGESNSFEVEDTVAKWKGTVWRSSTSTAIALNDCLELVSGRAAPCSTGTAPVLGVAKTPATTSSFVVVATAGNGIDCKGTGSITSANWVKKAASGAVTIATDGTEAGVVGFATSANSGAGLFIVSLSQRNMVGQ